MCVCVGGGGTVHVSCSLFIYITVCILYALFAHCLLIFPFQLSLQTSFSNVEENILAALGDKNPSVKAETALFLARCFKQCTPALMPKPLLNTLCPPLIQVCVGGCSMGLPWVG